MTNVANKYHVIDNFYENPDSVRDLALSLDYIDISKDNYPGYQSSFPCLGNGVIQKFESYIQGEVDVESSRALMGHFRWIPGHGESRLKVHTDMLDWTVVIYLSPDGPKEAGTNIYRHKETGLIGPPDSELMKKLGFSSFKEYEDKIVVPDTLDPDAWEIIDNIEYQYNRCLLFKANELFHSHTNGFGSVLKDARMTQNFFFNVKG
jgi:hypothetical protein